MKRLFIQTQLSNYTRDGLFVLECDSGWQMVAGRMRELQKLGVQIDVTGPMRSQLVTQPEELTPGLNFHYLQNYVPPNAPLSRYHFDSRAWKKLPHYDAAYINDPMQFRNFKTVLDCSLFAVHNHFIDNPSCPKFGGTMWLGQCEAAQRADVNFWQCASAYHEFYKDAIQTLQQQVWRTSEVWDDGYSIAEITSPVNMRNVRFDPEKLKRPLVFIPNRVGGNSDYTNCGRFLEMLPKTRDYLVVAGNPSQKISNLDLAEKYGTLFLVNDALTRDEYKLIARNSDVVVALYDKDTYGGTAVRECIELGALPLWLNCYEYASLSEKAEYPFACEWSTVLETLDTLLDGVPGTRLREVVRARCSHEATTAAAARRMGLCE